MGFISALRSRLTPRSAALRRNLPLRAAFILVVALAAGILLDGAAHPADARDPRPDGIRKIDHVLVLMQENRSFDSYFGQLHYHGQPDAEAEPPNAANPDPLHAGGTIAAYHKTELCEAADLDHSWSASHRQWNGGAMNGFTSTNVDPADPSGRRAMGYYTDTELPYYYDLYRTFATSDRYFASVLGPTFPNRFYLLAGTSFGFVRNELPNIFDPNSFQPPPGPPGSGLAGGTIFEQLDNAGISWKIYFAEIPFAFEFGYVRSHFWGHVFPISQYYTDAARGDLPQVAYIDPILLGFPNIENDEHPPSNVQVGERFVADVIDALFRSPDWDSSALFLTYDEHGGFYDHVAPPAAPAPDAIAPDLAPGDPSASFDRYGIRVPVVVVSPYSKPHSVSHVVNDHTSILKFIETRFGLPSLTHRDALANPMLEFFDFDRASFRRPPHLRDAPVRFC